MATTTAAVANLFKDTKTLLDSGTAAKVSLSQQSNTPMLYQFSPNTASFSMIQPQSNVNPNLALLKKYLEDGKTCEKQANLFVTFDPRWNEAISHYEKGIKLADQLREAYTDSSYVETRDIIMDMHYRIGLIYYFRRYDFHYSTGHPDFDILSNLNAIKAFEAAAALHHGGSHFKLGQIYQTGYYKEKEYENDDESDDEDLVVKPLFTRYSLCTSPEKAMEHYKSAVTWGCNEARENLVNILNQKSSKLSAAS